LDEVDEAAAFAGFRAKDPELSAAFCELLVPLLRNTIRKRWKSLKYVHDEMLSHCGDTLLEWRDEGSLSKTETIKELADRLVRAAAVVYQRAEDKDERLATGLADEPRERLTNPEKVLLTRRLRERVQEIQATLPAKHQRVLAAYAQSETDGKPMAEILGVSLEAARKMSERARAALGAAIRRAGLKASDFLETNDD
jgi:DNA-directed RNA polymerase specialized sigma24 family protein